MKKGHIIHSSDTFQSYADICAEEDPQVDVSCPPVKLPSAIDQPRSRNSTHRQVHRTWKMKRVCIEPPRIRVITDPTPTVPLKTPKGGSRERLSRKIVTFPEIKKKSSSKIKSRFKEYVKLNSAAKENFPSHRFKFPRRLNELLSHNTPSERTTNLIISDSTKFQKIATFKSAFQKVLSKQKASRVRNPLAFEGKCTNKTMNLCYY